MAIVRNLATVKTTADITSSATSIPVNRVDVFGTSQTTLDNPFYVTIMPASGDEPANLTNSEIVLVTGISGTNLTVTRGQRSTTAKAFNSGAIVTMAIYAEDAVLLGDEGMAVGTPASWIDTSDIKNGAITTDKIADGAVKSAKIDLETLPGSAGTTTVSGKMSGTSWANIGDAFKAPSNGLYFATAIFNQNGNPGGTSFLMGIRIVAAGNDISAFAPSAPNYAGNHNCTITLSRMTWLTAGQTIQMQGRTENWSGGVAGKMEVTRIY